MSDDLVLAEDDLVALVDSSALVALADRRDAQHLGAVAAYNELVTQGYKLFTTNYLVSETLDLLRAGLGPALAQVWLRDHRLPIYHADEFDERRARAMVITSRNTRGLSMTDAISAVVMDRLGVQDVIAVDPYLVIEAP
jgi:predicted nucleic acid-binding protein